MAAILSVSIDLSKIDKTRIVPGKGTAKYYNLQIFVNDEKDNYQNDVSVAEGQTKEERAAKVHKKYLGNGRKIWEGRRANTPIAGAPHAGTPPENPDNDLPF